MEQGGLNQSSIEFNEEVKFDSSVKKNPRHNRDSPNILYLD